MMKKTSIYFPGMNFIALAFIAIMMILGSAQADDFQQPAVDLSCQELSAPLCELEPLSQRCLKRIP